jgi:hypothetical protein
VRTRLTQVAPGDVLGLSCVMPGGSNVTATPLNSSGSARVVSSSIASVGDTYTMTAVDYASIKARYAKTSPVVLRNRGATASAMTGGVSAPKAMQVSRIELRRGDHECSVRVREIE